jgi:diguanylate cyclase (GGDEF)-like protein
LEFKFSKANISDESQKNIEDMLTPKKGPQFYLSFDKSIESLFSFYSLSTYKKINFVYPFVGVACLFFFLFADYQVAPDAIYDFLYARLLGFTSIFFTALVFIKKIDKDKIRTTHHFTQIVMCGNALIVHASLLLVGYIASTYGDFHYQTGSILIIILFCSVIRVNFYYAMPTVFLILVSQLFFMKSVINASDSVFLEHVYIYTSVAFFGCLANARMESEIRKNFLKSLSLELKKQNLEQAKDELLQLSISDPLTGLTNRRGFDQNIAKIWLNAIRNKYPVSFLMIDVDLFKQYNDSQGHLGGDSALKKIADIFKYKLKRPGDMVARLGGEEFGIVLPQTDSIAATLIAEFIRKAIWEQNIFHPASKVDERLTISIGIATVSPEQNSSYKLVIEQADIALYQAKENGRNKVQQYVSVTGLL